MDAFVAGPEDDDEQDLVKMMCQCIIRVPVSYCVFLHQRVFSFGIIDNGVVYNDLGPRIENMDPDLLHQRYVPSVCFPRTQTSILVGSRRKTRGCCYSCFLRLFWVPSWICCNMEGAAKCWGCSGENFAQRWRTTMWNATCRRTSLKLSWVFRIFSKGF